MNPGNRFGEASDHQKSGQMGVWCDDADLKHQFFKDSKEENFIPSSLQLQTVVYCVKLSNPVEGWTTKPQRKTGLVDWKFIAVTMLSPHSINIIHQDQLGVTSLKKKHWSSSPDDITLLHPLLRSYEFTSTMDKTNDGNINPDGRPHKLENPSSLEALRILAGGQKEATSKGYI